ncbi:nuclear transport factor 2 family protein [Pseudonocardia aurantiaca]|uniref:Nuclear transport factor 2 family protein n=1 Tax=Pseudonocardia aurantiaca TaxID=75290 RepID=A0ABW4FQ85_9PSEU
MLEGTTPAQRASYTSVDRVSRGDREGWLDLFDDDAVVEDPVGVSPLDPAGKGHRGKIAIGAFWDNVISTNASWSYRIDQSFPRGDECANWWTCWSERPDGTVVEVPMITLYKVDDSGKLVSLRAFWDAARWSE